VIGREAVKVEMQALESINTRFLDDFCFFGSLIGAGMEE
jgi:hypothetical protein